MRPNLFLIGAPKSGTSSMSHWLGLHRDICFSDPKELHYFASDFKLASYVGINNLHDYEQCFKCDGRKYKFVSEGSTSYLMSEIAVENIIRYSPGSKFILMLRNPIEMFYSYYSYMYYRGVESEEDMVNAWGLQKKRENGQCIPKGCWEPKMLLYKDVCSIGTQLNRFLGIAGSYDYHIVWYDDLKKDNRQVFKDVLSFLDLSLDFDFDLKSKNISKTVRNNSMHRVLCFLARCKRKIGIKKTFGMIEKNTKNGREMRVDRMFGERLLMEFKAEIEILEKMTGRNLSNWKDLENVC